MSAGRDHMHIINRINEPTPFCYEPYTTQWRIQKQDGTELCYIQASMDESKPNWVKYGDILEHYMYHKLEDQKFMKDILIRYPHRTLL